MGITKLISSVGDENIELQNISNNLDSARINGGNGRITFLTAPDKVTDLMAGNESKFVGLVVWIPRNRIPKI